MPLDALIGLATANFVSSLVPGQNTALVANSAANHGSWAAMTVISGVIAADLVWAVLALLMLDGLLVISSDLLTVMRAVGGCLLVIIGASIWWSASSATVQAPVLRFCAENRFASGFLVGAANPMAFVFFLSILPLFIQGDTPATTLYFGSVATIVVSSAAALSPYTLFSLVSERRYQMILAKACSVVLVVFGALAAILAVIDPA